MENTSGWRLVARRTNLVIRGLELSVPPLQGVERLNPSTVANDLINCDYVMKPPLIPEGQGSESFRSVPPEVLGEWHLEKARELRAPSPPPALCVSSIWLFLS